MAPPNRNPKRTTEQRGAIGVAENLKFAVGIISGTSMDGIDVAAIETDGEAVVRRIGGRTFPYPDAVRSHLLDVIAAPDVAMADGLSSLEAEVTDAHADALLAFLDYAGIALSSVDVAGFHGQTVLHRPEIRFTRQLLDGCRAAERTGIDVVAQFRLADVAAGGQGAPLVPLYHRALVACSGLEGAIAVLNLGGVGNVTYVDGDNVLAFDTGPASALIDDWVRAHGRGDYDHDGLIAGSGRVDERRLSELMAAPFFLLPPPKSLDRNAFRQAAGIVDGLSLEDGAATLTAFTIAATAAARVHMPAQPHRWLVAGGGRLNSAVLGGLRRVMGVPVDPVEVVGWDGDTLEAECFAYLAVRSMAGATLSLPSTTGVPRPMTGGVHFKPGLQHAPGSGDGR